MDQLPMPDIRARQSLYRPESFRPFERTWLEHGIPRCFEQRAAICPDHIAIADGFGGLSYQALNLAANRLAHHLLKVLDSQENGTAPIVLLAGQGRDAITAVLAVLKAGRIVAPLDQRTPISILSGVLDRLSPAALLVDDECEAIGTLLAADRYPVLAIDSPQSRSPDSNPDRTIEAHDVACIYFTSGSTGLPKGVADSHRNVLHNIMRYTNSLGFAEGDRMSLVQNPSFSGTMSTIFGALLNGATLV
ncbi:MAG: AMP-binding protein, partial [Granulosicoccus sp.]|nr:AMP-binding protein [Granulosicoccus sp.]